MSMIKNDTLSGYTPEVFEQSREVMESPADTANFDKVSSKF